MKQDYRRKSEESYISVCVLHYCSLCLFFRVVMDCMELVSKMFLGSKKKNKKKTGCRWCQEYKNKSAHISAVCELWKGCELDSVSGDLVLIYPSRGRGLDPRTLNTTTWQPGSLTFRQAVANAERPTNGFNAPHYFYSMTSWLQNQIKGPLLCNIQSNIQSIQHIVAFSQ